MREFRVKRPTDPKENSEVDLTAWLIPNLQEEFFALLQSPITAAGSA
jgi:hypothetical protein